MRSEDEEDEEDYDEIEDNEEDELDGLDGRPNGGVDDEAMEFYDDGSGEDNEDNDDEEGGDDDEDDDEEEEDGDDNENDNEDEDEDEDDEEDGDEDDHSDDEPEDADMNGSTESPSSDKQRATSPSLLYQPPHLIRRSMFVPDFTSAPTSLSVEAIVAIPQPCAVYAIAASTCSSYLLSGGVDGYVRAYDFWASVNGNQLMTAQQRTLVGLGEGVSKAGVVRGWWDNKVDAPEANGVNGVAGGSGKLEPIYSMTMEGDALWALTGTQSGPINLYTVRHAPGHHITSLKGHSKAVSVLTLLPREQGFLSGSWDGTVREWDLNTGQTVRQYPTHGAQISSLSLRPFSPISPTPSPQAEGADEEESQGDHLDVYVRVGADFFSKDSAKPNGTTEAEGEAEPLKHPDQATTPTKPPDSDVPMSAAPSPYDPLFDDDADGETAIPSGDVTMAPTPAINDMAPPSPPKAKGPGLALPGMAKDPSNSAAASSSVPSTPLFAPQMGAGASRQAADQLPLLTKTNWKAYSDDVMLMSAMDGSVALVDRRVSNYEAGPSGVGRFALPDKTPPWCMSACWSGSGTQVLAGRRNGTVDIWDIRRTSSSTAPNLLRTLRTPAESGAISCVIGLPDGKHVATASQDNIRLWNTSEYFHPEEQVKRSKSKPPFKIIAGHHGGNISSMLVDPTSRFLTAASGDRGWQGEPTKVVLIHEIKW